MHRPRRRGARPPLLALLAALLLAARGAAAQGKRSIGRRAGPPGPGHTPAGSPGAGQTGSVAPASGDGRRPVGGLASATPGAGEAGEGIHPGAPLWAGGAPGDFFLGSQPQLSALTGSVEGLGVVGRWDAFRHPHLSLDP